MTSLSLDRDPMLTIRPAGRRDLDAIERIERQSFDRDRFSRRNLRRALARGHSRFLIAEEDGQAAGYAMLLLRRGAKTARIYSIAVDPEHRGTGIANALVTEAERVCRSLGVDRLRLEVRPSNLAAARLYERAGFAPFERKTGYYPDGEDAIRYEKRVEPEEPGDRSAHA